MVEIEMKISGASSAEVKIVCGLSYESAEHGPLILALLHQLRGQLTVS
jgi:hypothetical protein